jgi:hypothetical protein
MSKTRSSTTWPRDLASESTCFANLKTIWPVLGVRFAITATASSTSARVNVSTSLASNWSRCASAVLACS